MAAAKKSIPMFKSGLKASTPAKSKAPGSRPLPKPWNKTGTKSGLPKGPGQKNQAETLSAVTGLKGGSKSFPKGPRSK